MKDNMEQHLDKLSKKIVKGQEFSLPEDFTQNIMNQVHALPSATEYKPLISKKVWFAIIASFLSLIYLALRGEGEGTLWLDKLGLNTPEFTLGDTFAQLQFSNVLLYSVVLFSVFVAVQIALVKRHQDQQLQF